jgi:HAD superfamily hydrolase (TIGR01450 family)
MHGLLLDLDGTIYLDHGAIPGAVELVRTLRLRGIPYRFVTNTTGRPRGQLVERLRGYGFEVSAEEIITPVGAAVALCRERGHRVVAPYVPFATLEDFEELVLEAGMAERWKEGSDAHSAFPPSRPTAVVVGDLGEEWTFARLNQAFRLLMDGADLIALSRDRYWMRRDGLALDAGPFVAGLELATGRTAAVTGKPNAAFFHAAVRSLGLPADTPGRDIVMVGDDVWSDVDGAQRAGYQGWLVRTGKFRAETLDSSGVVPERVLENVAELVSVL